MEKQYLSQTTMKMDIQKQELKKSSKYKLKELRIFKLEKYLLLLIRPML